MDVAKGVLILLLIEHHRAHVQSYNSIDTSMFDSHLGSWQLLFICFFMQAFFLISGYCSNFDKPAARFLWTQTKGILIPYVFFQIAWCLFFSWYFPTYSWKQDILQIPNTTYWFFIALFISKIIVFLLHRKFAEKTVVGVSLALTFLGILNSNYGVVGNYFAINQCLMACFFIAIGAYLKRNPNLYDRGIKYSITIFPWLFVILIMFKRDIPFATGAVNCSLQYIPVWFVLTITGSLSCLYISRWIGRFSSLEFIGKNSIITYGFHYCVAIYVSKQLWDTMRPNGIASIAIYIATLLVSVVLVCIMLSKLFQYKPFSWLLGKW